MDNLIKERICFKKIGQKSLFVNNVYKKQKICKIRKMNIKPWWLYLQHHCGKCALAFWGQQISGERWTNSLSKIIEKDGKFAERLLVYFLYFLGFLVKSDTFLLRYHACSNGLKILTTDTTLLVPWDLWQATKGQTAEYSHWKDEANLKQTQPNLPKNLICIRTVIV